MKCVGILIFVIEKWMAFLLFFNINLSDFSKNAMKDESLKQFSDKINKIALKKWVG